MKELANVDQRAADLGRGAMKAATYDEFGAAELVLRIRDIEERPIGPGEARVRVRASAINPYDVKFRAGVYTETVPRPGFVPHCDGAGVIVAVGEGIPTGRIGERVWLWGAAQGDRHGTAAEFVVLPAAHAAPLPHALSFEQGACLGIPYLTAYQNLLRDGPIAGQIVLVSGGGGAVGFLAVQLAKLSGAQVLATAGTPASLAHALRAGADAVIDYRREDIGARVAELTDGAGADRLIEVEFGRNLSLVTRVLRPGGVVSSYGSAASMKPSFDFGALQAHGATLHFRSVHRMDEALRRRAIEDLAAFVARGLRLPPIEGFALADVAAAHLAVEAGAGVARRVVVP